MSNSYPAGQPTPIAGWYADPIDGSRERYWDGQAWTHELRPVAAPQAMAEPRRPLPQRPAEEDWQPGATALQVPGPRTPDGYPLAGWWQRVGANLIDGLVILALTLLVSAPVLPNLVEAFQGWWADAWYAAQVGRQMPDPESEQYGIMDAYGTVFLINRAVGFAYATALQMRKGATLGMLALGMRVVPLGQGAQHNGLSVGTAAVRNLTFGVAGLFWVAQLVNCFAPLANRNRQALHDMLARTQVVRVR